MSSLLAIAVLAAGLLACFGWGGMVLYGAARVTPRRDPFQVVLALALGMGVLAYLILACGLLRHLSGAALSGLVLCGAALAAYPIRCWRAAGPLAPPDGAEEPPEAPAERWVTLFLIGYLGLLALLTLASALKPPDGLEWDSLSYHLAAPKIYLREGRIPFIGYDSHTDFPFTMEMLYTLGLSAGGPAAAKLFHWTAGWLTALGIGLWTARLSYAGRRLPFWAGPLAAACFASMPLVLWELGTAYVDLGTALFQLLALLCLMDAAAVVDGKWEIEPRGAALAGVFSGFALGTKYTALVQFGLLGLGVLWVLARSRSRVAAVRSLVGFGGLGLLVALPWYLKNWLWVHNPVYPFFSGLFPHSFSWTAAMTKGYNGEQYGFGIHPIPHDIAEAAKEGRPWLPLLGPVLGRLPMLPWDFAFHGRAFYAAGPRTVLADKLGALGPVWAGMLPLLLWARGLPWQVRAILLYAAGSLGFWFLLSHQTRYLLPVFAPLAAVAVVALVAVWPSRVLRIAGAGFMGLVLLLNLAMHAPLAAAPLELAAGRYAEGEYLDTSLPGLYEAAGFINQLSPNTRVAMYQETRGFYFDRPYFWANPGQHDMVPYERLASGPELAAELRRFGITHVLINYDFSAAVRNQAWYLLLMDAVRKGAATEVFRSRNGVLERRGVFIYDLR